MQQVNGQCDIANHFGEFARTGTPDQAATDPQTELSDARRPLTALERLIDDLDPGENTDPLRIVAYIIGEKVDVALGALAPNPETPAPETPRRPSAAPRQRPARRRVAA